MIDTTQLLLTIVLTLTTFLLIFVGVQLIFVLRELRTTLRKVNTIIDSFENIGVGLDHGFAEVVGFINGIKTLLKVIDHLPASKKHEKTK